MHVSYNGVQTSYTHWGPYLDRLRPEDKEGQLLLNLEEVYGLEGNREQAAP